jgi:voltage-gated potassium channel
VKDLPTPEESRLYGDDQETRERWDLLHTINDFTDRPMIVLSMIWLVLLIVDFTSGLSSFMSQLSNAIWILFILDFLLEFTIAPRKKLYLRRSWLTAVSLMIPALRIFRIFQALRILRAVRVTRSLSMVRLISSLNRGMRALRNTFSKRGFGYAVALTVIVILTGAAGMLQFESPSALRQAGHIQPGATGGFDNYGDALWWTGMVMTTIGSEYWPVTGEGRMLAWLLSLYGLAIFGYLTATVASHFISQDTGGEEARAATARDAEMLRQEVVALRTQISAMMTRLDAQPAQGAPEE